MAKIVSGYVDRADDRFPALLGDIADPPKRLYYKGHWSAALFDVCLGVVGSRRMTTYGRHVAEKLVYEVAGRGITIVSGFMYGIDATAHGATLSAEGKTIAVMPCGIDLIHPPHQKDLYKRILDGGGLVMSEYKGDEKPQNWMYPRRNRIIAGLSKAVLVIEAAMKSGSLITANYAKKYNKRLLAIPGNITSSNSEGTLHLIKNGAVLVKDSNDVLAALGLQVLSKDPMHKNKESDLPLINLLLREPMNIDELSRAIGASSAVLGTQLSLLQLRGEIFEEQGKYYAC